MLDFFQGQSNIETKKQVASVDKPLIVQHPYQYRKYLMQSGQLQKEQESVQINPTTAYGHIRSAHNEDKGGQYPRNDHSEFRFKRVFCPTCREKFTVDQLKLHMPTCQGHSQTTDAQLSQTQTDPYVHIRSDLHNEDVGLYSRRDELRFRTVDELKEPNPSRERSMERPESSSQIALNMAPNSSRGTSIEKLAGSSSRIANLKLALPKPVSSAPLFDAYSESSRLNDDDDDIQGSYLLTY